MEEATVVTLPNERTHWLVVESLPGVAGLPNRLKLVKRRPPHRTRVVLESEATAVFFAGKTIIIPEELNVLRLHLM